MLSSCAALCLQVSTPLCSFGVNGQESAPQADPRAGQVGRAMESSVPSLP